MRYCGVPLHVVHTVAYILNETFILSFNSPEKDMEMRAFPSGSGESHAKMATSSSTSYLISAAATPSSCFTPSPVTSKDRWWGWGRVE